MRRLALAALLSTAAACGGGSADCYRQQCGSWCDPCVGLGAECTNHVGACEPGGACSADVEGTVKRCREQAPAR